MHHEAGGYVSSLVVGLQTSLVLSMVPDTILGDFHKVVLAAVLTLVTGTVHGLTKRLFRGPTPANKPEDTDDEG